MAWAVQVEQSVAVDNQDDLHWVIWACGISDHVKSIGDEVLHDLLLKCLEITALSELGLQPMDVIRAALGSA